VHPAVLSAPTANSCDQFNRKQPIEAPRKFPKATWVKPTVMVEAEHRAKNGQGLLRHPAFKGIRRDLMD
jgi:bifunctional non-homologous end joining protein LigD